MSERDPAPISPLEVPPAASNALNGEGFGDIAAARRRIADGEFVHAPTGGGSGLVASFYGESVITRSSVEREWTDFELVDFIDDRRRLPQAVIVLRKPLHGS